ncbi:hypothetical protein VNO77_44165 [Canavalia gladiata]|uniref:Uncharacterized protein n=1 Tax=Canavalia gladiata TaxID=3824 RepID=A0AAN9JXQ2_CANGL
MLVRRKRKENDGVGEFSHYVGMYLESLSGRQLHSNGVVKVQNDGDRALGRVTSPSSLDVRRVQDRHYCSVPGCTSKEFNTPLEASGNSSEHRSLWI